MIVRPAHPFVAGWDAYAAGQAAASNPHLATTPAGLQWSAGFTEHAGMDPTGQGRDFPASQMRESPAPWWADR